MCTYSHIPTYRKLERSEPNINNIVNFSINRDAFIIFWFVILNANTVFFSLLDRHLLLFIELFNSIVSSHSPYYLLITCLMIY